MTMVKYVKYFFLAMRLIKAVVEWIERNIEVEEGPDPDEIKVRKNGVSK